MNKTKTFEGRLFIVPTPIGNLKDITIRALEVLKTVDYILAEDTRNTIKLLKHYQIKKTLKSYHKFNEHNINENIISDLRSGKNIALVSDAGTPGISDPGYLIIKKCIEENINIECLPGPTALIPALVISGFPADRFIFEGFLPHKKGRKKRLEEISKYDITTILYESPHRLLKTLTELKQYIDNKKICICRELTKVYETIIRGNIEEVINYFNNKPIKGEIVIVISK
jgi:16S rRNA (cytidine1402-2'-O)-methyltransferase